MTGEATPVLRAGLPGPRGIGTIGEERARGDRARAVDESGETAVTFRDELRVVGTFDAVRRTAGARS
jgi:hypothetical protein